MGGAKRGVAWIGKDGSKANHDRDLEEIWKCRERGGAEASEGWGRMPHDRGMVRRVAMMQAAAEPTVPSGAWLKPVAVRFSGGRGEEWKFQGGKAVCLALEHPHCPVELVARAHRVSHGGVENRGEKK